MIALATALLQRGAERWTAAEVHDTVAAIVRQPEFATPLRQSLAGRLFRYIAERVSDLIELWQRSPSSRAIVITAVVLVLLVVVARIFAVRRIDADGRLADDGATHRRGGRRDPWRDADERATAGDFEAATHSLYAAVVESLARSGAITPHPSKTSGDYARELARRSTGGTRDFRAFAREADRVIFGTLRPDAADYERLRAAAERIAGVPAAA